MHYDHCTLDEVDSALRVLDCCDSDLWIAMGMAIKSEFGDAGFGIWDSWSQGYPKYKASEARMRWRSFKPSGGRGTVRIGSLFHAAIQRGWRRERPELTAEEKKAWAVERARRLHEVALQQARDEAEINHWYNQVSAAALRVWVNLGDADCRHDYLKRKQVGAFGVRFVKASTVIHTNEAANAVTVIAGADSVKAFFASKDPDARVRHLKKGDLLIPVADAHGVLWNLQIINKQGTKMFLSNGRKSGCFHLIGALRLKDDSQEVVVLCEGYATGASIYMSTGWLVVVCFDAGNMPAVAEHLAPLFPSLRWAVAADDDEIGLKKAREAADILHCNYAVPNFLVG